MRHLSFKTHVLQALVYDTLSSPPLRVTYNFFKIHVLFCRFHTFFAFFVPFHSLFILLKMPYFGHLNVNFRRFFLMTENCVNWRVIYDAYASKFRMTRGPENAHFGWAVTAA